MECKGVFFQFIQFFSPFIQQMFTKRLVGASQCASV